MTNFGEGGINIEKVRINIEKVGINIEKVMPEKSMPALVLTHHILCQVLSFGLHAG